MVVAGVGLIGGSLALAVRKKGLVKEVIGYGRGEKNLRLAKKRRIIDGYFLNQDKFPSGVDLLLFATPVEAMVPLARSFLPRLKPGCLVTDVGSVKGKVIRDMERLLSSRVYFVGAHPIAGNEQWGAEAARDGLFEGHRCILTPTQNTNASALKKVSVLWLGVGAKVEIMDGTLHDKVLAIVSHLPHVLVYALVNTLGRSHVDGVDVKDYCAGGFKDFTRIASSRPEIWRDICLANRKAVSESLGDYIEGLQKLERSIRAGRGGYLEKEFAKANAVRSQIP